MVNYEGRKGEKEASKILERDNERVCEKTKGLTKRKFRKSKEAKAGRDKEAGSN